MPIFTRESRKSEVKCCCGIHAKGPSYCEAPRAAYPEFAIVRVRDATMLHVTSSEVQDLDLVVRGTYGVSVGWV